MARPRSFDHDRILASAMHCFRRLGYERASIKDLEKATGLTSGSLYNTFGSKDGLFAAALDHYIGTVIAARTSGFAGPAAGLADLEKLFLSLWEMPQADGFGCLITNSAVEFGADAPAFATEKIAKGLETADRGIRSVLMRVLGDERGMAEADNLAMIYHGSLVLSRAGQLSDAHRAAIRATFRRLRAMTGSTT